MATRRFIGLSLVSALLVCSCQSKTSSKGAAKGAAGDVTDPYVAFLLGKGDEARADIRGTLVGVFNTMGGIGIIIVSGFGGYIYDAVGRASPFTMMGILNGLLLVAAIAVRLRAGEPSNREAAAAH